ncbi:MAG TPA: hypothetical protein PLL19_11915 [Thiobacillaceae bacterium]|nr:hypothetical protein [Thiobacillaceae bacterium]HNI08139.1 hypothetical protein [Thiobacillaceae bacterium]
MSDLGWDDAGNPDASAADALLARAMAGYRADPVKGDFLLNYACTQAADPLPLYRVVSKFYNRQRRFEQAQDFARKALAEAGRQCGLPDDPETWRRAHLPAWDTALASHALLALKAMAYIALRREDPALAARYLAVLSALDPEDGSGVSVVSAMADSLEEAG